MLGKGCEHFVYQSRFMDLAIKKPTVLNIFSLAILGNDPAAQIQKEISVNRKECNKAGILVPRTRVFRFDKGYLMVQEKIIKDGSLPQEEIERRIKEGGSRLIYDAYRIQPDNFAAKEKDIYMLDLTMGIFRQGEIFLSYETQNHIKAEILEKLRHKW